MSDFRLPTIWGLMALGCNIALNALLVNRWSETGLALATSIAATVQIIGLLAMFSRRHGALPWGDFLSVFGKTLLASSLAVGGGWWLSQLAPPGVERSAALAQIAIAVVASAVSYIAILRVLRIAPWHDWGA